MLCDSTLCEIINRCFVPLYLRIEEAQKLPNLPLPPIPNAGGHVHFTYILTDDAVINVATPNGHEMDSFPAYKASLESIVSRLHLTPGTPLPPYRRERPAGTVTLRVVSRYSFGAPCRRWIDLAPDDQAQLLPPPGVTDGSYALPPDLARRILVALRPVSTPRPQKLAQSEPDDRALPRVQEAVLVAAVHPASGSEAVVTLQGRLRFGPRPELEGDTMHMKQFGDPEGHLEAAQATVQGYVRFNRATRQINSMELVADPASLVWGRQAETVPYQAAARLYTP